MEKHLWQRQQEGPSELLQWCSAFGLKETLLHSLNSILALRVKDFSWKQHKCNSSQVIKISPQILTLRSDSSDTLRHRISWTVLSPSSFPSVTGIKELKCLNTLLMPLRPVFGWFWLKELVPCHSCVIRALCLCTSNCVSHAHKANRIVLWQYLVLFWV